MNKKIAIMFGMFLVFGFLGVSAASAETATGTDATAPVISGVSATSTAATSTVIIWTTDEPADGQVEYGTGTAYGLSSATTTATTTSHQIALSGLTASTAYHYMAKSRDAAGNLATSSDYMFTTLAAVTPPATTTADVSVKVKVEPKVLNTRGNGKWIEASVSFPEGYDARNVDSTSIKLNNTIAPDRVKAKKHKLELKFPRSAVVDLLAATATTTSADFSTPFFGARFAVKEIAISGKIGDKTFRGITSVKLLLPNDFITFKKEKREENREEHSQTINLPTATTTVNLPPVIALSPKKSEDSGSWWKRLFQWGKRDNEREKKGR